MKVVMPDYYKKFRCIGSECKDNCCIGWEIDIDEDTDYFFQNTSSEFKEKLKKNINRDEEAAHFILGENGRCPFLNKENLCDIIINFGDENIPYICREHPRFYNWYGDVKEVGLGLCCEEVCRIVFSCRDKIQLEVSETTGSIGDEISDKYESLFMIREKMIDIIQDRSTDIDQRLTRLVMFTRRTQCEPCNEQEFEMHDLFALYKNMEILDGKWLEFLMEAEEHLEEIEKKRAEFMKCHNDRSFEYEHIIVYFIYRYFTQAFIDNDIVSAVNFSLLSYIIINLLDIYIWLYYGSDHRIELVKGYSKEIEYSEENIEAVMTAGCLYDSLKTENLLSFISVYSQL